MKTHSRKTVSRPVPGKVIKSVGRLDEATVAKMPVGKLREMVTGIIRMDSWVSALTGAGTARDKKEHAYFLAAPTNWRENIDLWRGDGLAGRIVELMPDEMTREGWELCVEGDDDHEIAKKVPAMLEDLGFDQKIHQGLCLERAVGGAGTVLGTTDLSGDMASPLDLKSVSKFNWCETFEPIELQVASWQNDPQLPRFGKPETYRLQPHSPGGTKRGSSSVIHSSRVLQFPGIVVSRRQITSQMGWGDAVLSRCRNTLRDYNVSWGAISHLISEYGLAVWKIKNLADIIALDKDEELKTRVEMMQLAMSMVNAVVLDAELEDYDRKQVPLTGLSDVLREMGGRLAADAGTPMTLLFGMSPGGMNATGEFDSRSWYDQVKSNQIHKLKAKIEYACRIAMKALGIDEPPNWYVKFKPLWQPTEKEQAEARLVQAQVDEKYAGGMGMGVLTKEELREQRFGGREFSFNTHVKGPIPVQATPAPAVGPDGQPLPAGETPPDAAALPPAGVATPADSPREALTGIQISSMMSIVQAAAKGELDRSSAKALLLTSFPTVTPEQADSMLGAVKAVVKSLPTEA